MTKLQTPLLSLGASKTIGNAITFQRRSRVNFAREKPVPSQPRSLAQMYQRWDYQDGIFFWNTLTPTQKGQYRVDGLPYRLTGFAYFMRYYLRNLPDLAGRWRLDEKTGATAYDSSKQANHGAIIGALPFTGLINGARWFDDVNDFISIPSSPSLRLTGPLSLECFALQDTASDKNHFINSQDAGAASGMALQGTGLPVGWLFLTGGVGWQSASSPTDTRDDTWHHYVLTYDLINIRFFRNGIEDAPPNPQTQPVVPSTSPVFLGNRFDGLRSNAGPIDHVAIYNRALTPAQILRHSERRHPL